MNGPATDLLKQAKSLLATGAADQAAEVLSALIEREPQNAEAFHLLGVISFQLQRFEDAIRLMETALSINPLYADATANLATAVLAIGDAARAEQIQRGAVAIKPDFAPFRFNLANILIAQGRLADAASEFREALALKPDFADAWSNLGTVLRDLDDVDGALAAFEAACTHRPTYVDAHYNRANALRDMGRLTEAEAAIRKVIALRHDHAKAYNALGNILSDMARPVEARDAFAEAVRLAPTWMPAASNFLSSLQYIPGIGAQSLAGHHRAWAARFTPAQSPLSHAPANPGIDRERPLNVGFVSPDFGRHPIGYFTASLFDRLDRTTMRPVVFSTRPQTMEDPISQRIAQQVDWRRVDGLSDDDLFQTIRDAHIDILFDMSGHTAGHRLTVFARKPAPVQISWIGYVGTTGVSQIDYILGDSIHAPPTETFDGPERILRMPNGYVCYAAPDDAPAVGPSPSLRKNSITFGSLNNPAKLNDDVLASFARIVGNVPNSTLLLRFRGLEDSGVRHNLHTRLAQFGLQPSRVTILGRGTHHEFLDTYNEIDIALDTFPYSGGLTTCEALWMGVPVVTFAGTTFAGRHASSHLTAAGLAAYVAESQSEFEKIAVELAIDAAALAEARLSLRRKVQTSPLCDGARFVRDFENVLRQAWHSHIDQPIS